MNDKPQLKTEALNSGKGFDLRLGQCVQTKKKDGYHKTRVLATIRAHNNAIAMNGLLIAGGGQL
ncbi:MAG TPA: hypothetical protein DEP78_03340 [Verrucomicrobiales bacterium]|nr:hypothetical protein [Verrucomicrobiales bacterium]HCB97278.1 hypothetical protein [Verrucomicrobiales bacterium]